jgi:alpha-D-xyloside xylohydrolase
MKKGIFCFSVIILSALNVLASVDYSDSTFSVKLPYAQTLKIGNSESPVFIETKSGKYCFQGTPAAILKSENVYFFNWVIDAGKEVKLTFTKNANEYKIQVQTTGIEDITKWGFSIKASKNEYFTGMMERVVDGEQNLSWAPGIKEAMNLRGQFLTTVVKPTVSLYCPFYISSSNYSLFVEGTWPGEFDFCRTNPDWVQVTFEGPFTAVIINTAKSPAELVQKQSLRVGPTILPPRWAFGTCRWRDNHTHRETYYDNTKVTAPYNSEVVEDILMMKAFDIPLSYYLVDRPWAKGPQGYNDFEWDPNRFPNAVDMISWLDSKDIKFMLWIAPWVMGDMHKEAIEKGYNIQGQLQVKKTLDRSKVDFTNPAAVEWWQKGLEKMLTQGVKGFKMDRAEEILPNDYNNKAFDGRVSREYHNDYPVMYAKAAYEIAKLVHGDDFITMPRAGYTGSSRYAVFWGGDTGAGSKYGKKTNPEALRSAIISLQKSAVIGFPIWGSDTGGYRRTIDHELTARWLAFSCFCPIMEVGPTEDRGFWDLTEEPKYDKELIAVWRLYAKIHTLLMDYSWEQAKLASTTGMPIARPLFLNFANQPQAWQDWQTYMYGPDILVSAVWEKDKAQQSLYLPAGEKWIDAWDKKVYTGGQTITIDTPVYKIPIFIRQGSSINLGDLNKLYRESMKLASKKPDLQKLQNKEFPKSAANK